MQATIDDETCCEVWPDADDVAQWLAALDARIQLIAEEHARAARGRPVSDGLSGFQRAWADALADAKRRADEEDQLMYDALQGKPFWRRGLAVEVTGQRAARCADPYDNVKPGIGRGDE